MNEQKQEQKRLEFFANLKALSKGGRTALKRSLGQPLSQVNVKALAALYEVMPALTPWEEEPYFLAACTACTFEDISRPAINFVDCLKMLEDESDGVKRRVLALLDTPWDSSGFFVRKMGRLLRMIRQKGYKPDVEILLKDLMGWSHNSQYVQLLWAKTFFGNQINTKEENNNVN